MIESWQESIGYAAATLTTLSFAPQVWKSWRTRDLSGVSLSMYLLFSVGVALWLVYGLMIGSWPVVAGNAITLALSLTVLVLRLRHP